MYKHILSLALALLLLTSVFTACAKSVKPLTGAELLELGEKYLLELDYEQAVVQFTTLIEIEPKNSRAYTGLAEAYIGLGDTDKAIEVLRQGADALPDDTDIQQMLNELVNSPQQQLPATESPTAANPVFDAETAFTIDGIELGVTDLNVAKLKYAGRSDYMSNLMNDDTEDTVYSMPYMDDGNPDNDMEFGYIFVQPLDRSAITYIFVRDNGFLFMGKYRVGDKVVDFSDGSNEFINGNRRACVVVNNGEIEYFRFDIVDDSPISVLSTSPTPSPKPAEESNNVSEWDLLAEDFARDDRIAVWQIVGAWGEETHEYNDKAHIVLDASDGYYRAVYFGFVKNGTGKVCSTTFWDSDLYNPNTFHDWDVFEVTDMRFTGKFENSDYSGGELYQIISGSMVNGHYDGVISFTSYPAGEEWTYTHKYTDGYDEDGIFNGEVSGLPNTIYSS
jgi:hypothetical protein